MSIPYWSTLPATKEEAKRKKPESVVDLVKFDHPLIRTAAPEFDFHNPPCDPIELARKVADNMLWYDGLGLSANQIGLPYRVFSMKTNPVLVCFNPEIVDQSSKLEKADEGCLTFPGITGKVKRYVAIRVRYQEPNGEFQTRTLNGLTARIFQHELDHMNGMLFTDHMTRLELELQIKKAKKRGYTYALHNFGGKPTVVEMPRINTPPPTEEFNPWIFKKDKL